MFLSLALLNGVFAISNGFNEDKFLSTFSVTDFVVGSVKYFRDMVKDENDYPSQQMIDQIQNMEGVGIGLYLARKIITNCCFIVSQT